MILHFGQLRGNPYYENDLVLSNPDGSPLRREAMSQKFGRLLRGSDLPYIRSHDSRHTAATNMHQLTEDFYSVGETLGHSLKGIGLTLGISISLDSVTARYIDV